MRAAPRREIDQLACRRQLDVVRQVEFDAGREFEAAPRGAFRKDRSSPIRGRAIGLESARAGAASASDVEEREARFLLRLHLEEAPEVRVVIVAAAPDAQRRGDQAFLDVVADRAAGNAAEVGQFVDAESPVPGVHDL